MKITHIFVDLDGVEADWTKAAVALHGRDFAQVLAMWPAGELRLHKILGMSNNALWKPIRARGADFWGDLEPYPWAHDLLRGCQTVAPTTILTAPSLDPQSAAGKITWLHRTFGKDFQDFLIGPAKASCARPGAVLIDDRDKNCEAFKAAGGHSIVFPQPWNSDHTLASARGPRSIHTEGPWGHILHRLREIERYGFTP